MPTIRRLGPRITSVLVVCTVIGCTRSEPTAHTIEAGSANRAAGDKQRHDTSVVASVPQDAGTDASAAASDTTTCPAEVSMPFALPALTGDLQAVKALLEAGTSPNGDGCGATPLMDALAPCIVEPGTPAKQEKARRARKRQIVELLLANGADAAQSDKDGATAIHAAAKADDDDRYLATLIARLVELGARADAANRFGVTPLMFAVERQRLRTTQVLLDAGANPLAAMERGETPLSIARAHGYADIIALLESRSVQDGGAH